MALIGITRADTFDYVSETDPCRKTIRIPDEEHGEGMREEVLVEEGATVFELGVLDVFLMGMIYDKSTSITRHEGSEDVGFQTRVNQTNIETVRFGLKGWRNFKNATGDDIPFVTEKRFVNGREYLQAADACLNALGIRLIRELGQAIKAKSEVTGHDAKN